jgi:outer membrane protein OmpA-like peptidoglycan-associated protein
MSTQRTLSLVTALVFAAATGGCATDEYGNPRNLTDAEKGAMIGAASGAVLGALVKKDKPAKGALIGAVGGGLAGGTVGHYMDSQKKDFEKQLAGEMQSGAIDIQKTGEHVLVVTMTAQTAFDTNATAIKPGFHPTLEKIAKIVNRYGKTHLTVIGHTDNVGTNDYNQRLSERRALAVNDALRGEGVVPQRLESLGKGESAPRVSNRTDEGRRANRRVEIVIEPVVADASAG